MATSIEKQYILGKAAGKTFQSGNVRVSLELHESTFKDREAQELCAKAIADFLSDSHSRLSATCERLQANMYTVWEADREGLAFLAGLMKGWAIQQGVEVSFAA